MKLNYQWPLPSQSRPIAIIGSGGIVKDAHLPAYQKADFEVLGVFDINPDQSAKIANSWSLKAFESLEIKESRDSKALRLHELAILAD